MLPLLLDYCLNSCIVSIRWTVYCPSHKKSVPLPQIFDSLSICDNVQQETEREASVRRGEALRRRSSSASNKQGL